MTRSQKMNMAKWERLFAMNTIPMSTKQQLASHLNEAYERNKDRENPTAVYPTLHLKHFYHLHRLMENNKDQLLTEDSYNYLKRRAEEYGMRQALQIVINPSSEQSAWEVDISQFFVDE